MAFMFVTSLCAACGVPVSYNPDLVPALNINGKKHAICLVCVERWNELHPELETVTPHHDAYEPQEVA